MLVSRHVARAGVARRWGVGIGILLCLLVLGGCGASPQPGPASLTVATVPGAAARRVQDFNPFSGSADPGTRGMIYEPLMIFSPLRPGVGTPWLATSYAWTDGGDTLTFQLRSGVRWSDGRPLTSADVAASFQILLQHPELRPRGLGLTGVTALSPESVALQFASPGYAELPLAAETYIVPRRIFASVDPLSFANPDPVGTGPYRLARFSASLYVLARNPRYWQASRVMVPELRYPAYTGRSFYRALRSGQIGWAAAYLPSIEKDYTRADPAHDHHWFPADGLLALSLNLTVAPFDQFQIRQAIGLAIDRQRLSATAEGGYEAPASPTGLLLPADHAYLSDAYRHLPGDADAAEAVQLLAQAGFHAAPEGVAVNADGLQLAFTLLVPQGYPDWLAIGRQLRRQLAQLGVQVTIRQVAESSWLASLQQGSYQMTFQDVAAGPTPWYEYETLLSSSRSAEIGQLASSDYERWMDPATDQLLAEDADTDDPALQVQAIQGLEQIMVDDVPVIPLLDDADWSEYRTSDWVGWPTASDPYALPAPYSAPDTLLVITHLRSARRT
jgi:peptide/nickel transport system substrate-binding protein